MSGVFFYVENEFSPLQNDQIYSDYLLLLTSPNPITLSLSEIQAKNVFQQIYEFLFSVVGRRLVVFMPIFGMTRKRPIGELYSSGPASILKFKKLLRYGGQ